MKFKTEKELELATEPFLKKWLKSYYWQVPNYNKVVDCVGIDHKDNLIGIEYKLRNWKRVLTQATINMLSFDYVYICMPHGEHINKLWSFAGNLGIGIIVHKDKTKIVLKAKKLEQIWYPNKISIIDYIKKLEEKNDTKTRE